MKRSLAAELAELATTAPKDVDLEQDDLGGGAVLIDTDDDLNDDMPSSKRARHVQEKAMRMRAGIDLGSKEYAGKTVTRAEAFFGSDESGADSLLADGSDKDSDEALNRSASEDDEAEDALDVQQQEVLRKGPKSRHREKHVAEERQQTSRDSDSQEDTEVTSGSGSDFNASHQDLDETGPSLDSGNALHNVYAEIQAADALALEQMKQRQAKERAKAAAVRNQHAIWDRLLEVRILLQKCLTMSHQLPPPDVVPTVSEAFSSVAEESGHFSTEALDILGEMSDLQSAIATQNPECEVPSQIANAAAGELDKAWEHLAAQYEGLKPYREQSVDKWYRKTLLTSGSAALKGSLRMLNQSISSQVANTMQSSDRLIRRARLPLNSAPRKLCNVSSEFPSSPGTDEDQVDDESYDDTEFYQQLLKELLEANGAMTHLGAQSGTRERKVKSLKDRRASKGRRLRYDVQDKLVNFMVAAKYEEPAMATRLFRNLFGQKTE